MAELLPLKVYSFTFRTVLDGHIWCRSFFFTFLSYTHVIYISFCVSDRKVFKYSSNKVANRSR